MCLSNGKPVLYLQTLRNYCSEKKEGDLKLEVLTVLKTKQVYVLQIFSGKGKGKALPLQPWGDPEGPRKLRFPDFMTTVQDGGRLSALRTAAFTPRKYSW